jgi:hypothetical protein
MAIPIADGIRLSNLMAARVSPPVIPAKAGTHLSAFRAVEG